MAKPSRDVRARRRNRQPGPVVVVPGGRHADKTVQAILDAQRRAEHGDLADEIRVFRFRHQLAPLCWLALQAAGLIAAPLGISAVTACVLAAVTVAVTVAATRHWPKFSRRHTQAAAAWAACWGLVAMWAGVGWWTAVGLLGWAFPYGFWLEHYRWRPRPRAARTDEPPAKKFERLAARMKWVAWLGPAQPIPGGTQFEIICDGSQTPIDKILSAGSDIAATFQRAVTEAFAESHSDGRKHHGLLTLLEHGTLDAVRVWDGLSIDLATGMAVIGRFPDGMPLHENFFNLPEDGVKHSIVAGADGSGKTATLNLSLAISASSGIIAPVILDPQEGQALPAWRDAVPYARGIEECITWLTALHAAMFARSRWMSNLLWCREHGDCDRGLCGPACKRRKGMGFFNPHMIDVPIIEITIDEAPILLAVEGAAPLILDLLKLGRKVGFRLRLAAQVPSLAELKAQEIRSILVGSNVICHRTGDAVTGGYVNLPNNPKDLPKFFADGKPTWGLGYAGGPDNRPEVTMRTDLVPDVYEVVEGLVIREPDPLVWGEMRSVIEAHGRVLADLQRAADDSARRQLQILSALRSPMGMGELASKLRADMTLTMVAGEVHELVAAGKLREAGDLLEAVPQ